jgi:hypothetical protein
VQPYVVKQGDYLAKIAHDLGFDGDKAWQDPSNADLRALRTNPNILFAGDLLQVPDPPTTTAATSLQVGSTNSFVSSAPTVDVTVTFVGPDAAPYASMAFTVEELPDLTGLTTDANGTATFQVPVTLPTATVTFTQTGETRPLSIGGMDPIETRSGIFKRLQNLGYFGSDVAFDPANLDLLRVGLLALQAEQSPPPDSAPVSVPPDSIPPRDSAPPGSSPPASSAPASSPSSPDSSPPSSAPSSSLPAPFDDAGLSDDGTLVDDMKALLLKAHGY